MNPLQSVWESLVVAREQAESGRPAETSLDERSMWKKNKSTIGLRQSYDFTRNFIRVGGLSRILARVGQINPRQLQGILGLQLQLLAQFGDLCAILIRGWCYTERAKVA